MAASAWHTAGRNPYWGKTHTVTTAASCTSNPLPSPFLYSLQASLPCFCLPSLLQDSCLLSPLASTQSITAVCLVPYFPGPSPHINTKYPHAVPILTSSSCFPNLPHCWLAAASFSANPPRLLCPLPLLPIFHTHLLNIPAIQTHSGCKESQQQTSQHPKKKNQVLQLPPSEVHRPPALMCSPWQMAECLRERSCTLTWHIAPN